MKRCLNRVLRVESLSMRALMAADVVVDENFNDGDANDFTSVYTNTQSAQSLNPIHPMAKSFKLTIQKTNRRRCFLRP